MNEPEASPGYTLFAHTYAKKVYLIDIVGRVIHSWDTRYRVRQVRLLENGNLMATGGGRLQEIDPAGNIVWECRAQGQHHAFLPMPNGNMLLLMRKQMSKGEAVALGANPDSVGPRGLLLDYIIEVQRTGPRECEIVWQWSVWEHLIQDFDPAQPNYGVVADHPELVDFNYLLAESLTLARSGYWLHVNAIDYNPELDQVILSPRNLGELWIIDHSTTREQAAGHSGGKSGRGGDLLYRWGNPAAYRAGAPADQQLYWAHHIQWIEPGLPGAGNIILFNNGNGHSGNKRLYSSIEEIAPPVQGAGYQYAVGSPYPPAAPVWSYTAEPPQDWYSALASGVQRLPNGNTLICSFRTGTIFEVTPDGKTVWKYINPVTADGPLRQGEPIPVDPVLDPVLTGSYEENWPNKVYQAYRYPPGYPGLQKLDLTPGDPIELPAVTP